MTEPSPPDITQMLIDWSNGDREALNKLMPVVYTELRRQAARHLRRERPGHTLQTTDLIHEAYLRLIDQKNVRWQNRAHFFAVAAQSMRRILVDHARRRHRAKRGGSAIALPLDEGLLVAAEKSEVDLLALDEALSRLVIDLSGRPGLEYHVPFTRARIGTFDVDLAHEFFQGFANHAQVTLHIDNLRGENAHHQCETVFKAFARALRAAVAFDATETGVPSTKGTLT